MKTMVSYVIGEAMKTRLPSQGKIWDYQVAALLKARGRHAFAFLLWYVEWSKKWRKKEKKKKETLNILSLATCKLHFWTYLSNLYGQRCTHSPAHPCPCPGLPHLPQPRLPHQPWSCQPHWGLSRARLQLPTALPCTTMAVTLLGLQPGLCPALPPGRCLGLPQCSQPPCCRLGWWDRTWLPGPTRLPRGRPQPTRLLAFTAQWFLTLIPQDNKPDTLQ